MVCIRCKMVVMQTLTALGYPNCNVEMGSVEIHEKLTNFQKKEIKVALQKFDLELIDDKKSILIEKIKKTVLEVVHYIDEPIKTNFSDYLSLKLIHDYTYLANLFSESEGITIEHYFIAHKIERVKEMLLFDELSLTEISYKMNYCSVSHLSSQFKKTTGITPTSFKMLNDHHLRLELN
ncbi:MAG: AraC family transcriptional regulator [Pelobium sp.]